MRRWIIIVALALSPRGEWLAVADERAVHLYRPDARGAPPQHEARTRAGAQRLTTRSQGSGLRAQGSGRMMIANSRFVSLPLAMMLSFDVQATSLVDTQ